MSTAPTPAPGGITMDNPPRPAPYERDAVSEGLQDQIDELTATVQAQQRQLTALEQRLAALSTPAGLRAGRHPGT